MASFNFTFAFEDKVYRCTGCVFGSTCKCTASVPDSSIVVGAVIGSVFGTAILVAVFSFFWMRRKRRSPRPPHAAIRSDPTVAHAAIQPDLTVAIASRLPNV